MLATEREVWNLTSQPGSLTKLTLHLPPCIDPIPRWRDGIEGGKAGQRVVSIQNRQVIAIIPHSTRKEIPSSCTRITGAPTKSKLIRFPPELRRLFPSSTRLLSPTCTRSTQRCHHNTAARQARLSS